MEAKEGMFTFNSVRRMIKQFAGTYIHVTQVFAFFFFLNILFFFSEDYEKYRASHLDFC